MARNNSEMGLMRRIGLPASVDPWKAPCLGCLGAVLATLITGLQVVAVIIFGVAQAVETKLSQ